MSKRTKKRIENHTINALVGIMTMWILAARIAAPIWIISWVAANIHPLAGVALAISIAGGIWGISQIPQNEKNEVTSR